MSHPSDIEQDVRQIWHRFLQQVEPFRPDLHRYCRALSRSVWDAEDLLQETLLRAFARLGDLSSRVDNPKAYLLRIASNLWIDQIRSARQIVASQIDMLDEPERSLEVREAATRLIELLSPQERAAVVLKDVFEFQLDEIAAISRAACYVLPA